jgi:hypothetical protein
MERQSGGYAQFRFRRARPGRSNVRLRSLNPNLVQEFVVGKQLVDGIVSIV